MSGRRGNRGDVEMSAVRRGGSRSSSSGGSSDESSFSCNGAGPQIVVGGICCGIVSLVGIILIVVSVNYVEWNELAFKKNTVTNNVDQSEVYENGRYLWGPSDEPLTFPSTFQLVSYQDSDLSIFSQTGLEFQIDVDVYYRLSAENLSAVFSDYGTAYHERFVDAIRASIKNTAPEFTVDEYLSNRSEIVERLVDNLNEDIDDLHIAIESHKLMLGEVRFPSRIQTVFLQTAVQSLENDKAILEQEVERIKKETERLVEDIHANITVLNRTAIAQAESAVLSAEAESKRILQEAQGTGINYLFTLLNLTESGDRARIFELLTILDNGNPKVVSGELTPLINFS